MGYISNRKARLQRQIVAVQAQIESLETILTEMSATGTQSYAFDSGEGSHRTTRRSLEDIQNSLDRLYARESHLINELYNMGVVSMKLRRKSQAGTRPYAR
jgi:hypothetical protein